MLRHTYLPTYGAMWAYCTCLACGHAHDEYENMYGACAQAWWTTAFYGGVYWLVAGGKKEEKPTPAAN